ncbi:Phosphomethylpyrimidine kinase type-1 [Parasphaerochaeta coccoides DSM 17374]|uniref:pyridoxal kinase n=1 Tax=Parasphaerochaeta coccoides (strain ATCC BAA-1237 / DSM 17374 / SPN1) TaxID=760011 RepID=F4GK84_PARC1|nr:Phosphomethylpyrimidine kinase type-1 [Parasphaerochaeta coccoides DSM 17374]
MLSSCIAVHDLSCHGKSSLTVIMPVLEAMGVEVSPLPTAILSTQTDGFSDYVFSDQTAVMKRVISHWEELGMTADAVYSGFLGSREQIGLVRQVIDTQKNKRTDSLVVIDPVLGDDGRLYGPMEDAMIPAMRELVTGADIVTPNMTEACLLCNVPWKKTWTEPEALEMVEMIHAFGPRNAVITGILLENDGGNHYGVAIFDGQDGGQHGKASLHVHERHPVSLPGSGDLFAALMCGFMLKRVSFSMAAHQAAGLTALAVRRTCEAGYGRRHGVAVALILPDVVDALRTDSCSW